jgi:UDP-N-acetylmuramyl pentapeptide phosphotransferase/UDP-N-acetylglucosamine-1-phosphate transferase
MDTQLNFLFILATAGISSFLMCLLLLVTQPLHARFSMDSDLVGIQKIHLQPVPRIGGIAIVSGMLAVPLAIYLFHRDVALHSYARPMLFAILAGMPAFIAGLVEDITKTVSVRARLIATFFSALLGAWMLGASLSRVDVIGLDTLLQFTPFSLVVTAIAVGGVANSVNIIDGFNGIASGSMIVFLAGIAVLAHQAHDPLVLQLSLIGIGAALGILALNFPTGRIFIGDGGAYLLGFWLAEMAVLLVARNAHITPWQLLAICAYPVSEVLFSMYRRRIIRKSAPGAPDRLHLHTLLYRRFICQRLPARTTRRAWVRNAAVACFLLPWMAFATTISVVYGNTLPKAFLITALQVFAYLAVYGRLVRGHWCLRPLVLLGLRRQTRERPV